MKKGLQALQLLRIVGILEGISYIVLLFVSMPLKYIYNFPKAVIVNGWIHGFLFVVLAILILLVWVIRKWKFSKALIAGVASLVPFGTFWFDKKLKQEILEIENN